MVTLTYDPRGAAILNVTDRGTSLVTSIRVHTILVVKKVASGSDIKTYFGDMTISDSYEDLISVLGWDRTREA